MSCHSIAFYGLSSCVHCRQAREFLEERKIPFEAHYVDLAEGQERSRLIEEVREHNPSISFPTIVVDGSKVIIGFRPDELSEALKK